MISRTIISAIFWLRIVAQSCSPQELHLPQWPSLGSMMVNQTYNIHVCNYYTIIKHRIEISQCNMPGINIDYLAFGDFSFLSFTICVVLYILCFRDAFPIAIALFYFLLNGYPVKMFEL